MAGKGKQWIPPYFGEKTYEDMSEVEKNILKEIGFKSKEYANLMKSNYLRLSA